MRENARNERRMAGNRGSMGWFHQSTIEKEGESELQQANYGGPRNLCCDMLGLEEA